MRILNKDTSIKEVANFVLQKAKYQKVIVCIDQTSDMEYIDKLIRTIGNNVIIIKYYYNKDNLDMLNQMLNSGIRIIIYNVSSEHFYNIQNNNIYLLNIFIPQSSFVLPYINNNESIYGDNLLVCNNVQKDYCSILCLYMLALKKVWSQILQNEEVDTTTFKSVDALVNGKEEFYSNLTNLSQLLKPYITKLECNINEDELPYYVYMSLKAILKMFEDVNNDNEQYIDFYKMKLSSSEVDKAYGLIVKYDILSTIKINSTILIKVSNALINRFKIIIKKYFNIKNIKLNKINKLIKNQSKSLNIDNLLYISYILNTI